MNISTNRRALGWMIVVAAAIGMFLPRGLRADGLIVVSEPVVIPNHFVFAPLEVTYHHVDVQVVDQVAVTRVDEVFHNSNPRPLEGTYIFPLPAGAHIDKFAMDINGKPAEAEMLDADKARGMYEEIVRKYKDPALMEYAGQGAVKVRIFPIEANSDKHVTLQYTQVLKNDAGLIEYTYPLNTEKFSSRPLHDVSVKVTLETKDPIKSIYCPTHNVEIRRDGDRKATVGYEETNARPDTDFKVVYSVSASEIGANLLSYRDGSGDGYFMLLASPGFSADNKPHPKDVCFVLDTSGSMADDNKLEQAKKALNFCLSNLNGDDRFQVIRFSTEAEPVFDGLVTADAAQVQKAKDFVKDLKPTGGTSLDDALVKALSLRKAEADRPYVVVFLTDGMPTVGDVNNDDIVEHAKKGDRLTRVFCFGIGNDVNTHLLDNICDVTRGAATYVSGHEDIEVKVSSFFSKVRDPVLTNVAVTFAGDGIRATQLYPSAMPDLFKGDSVTVLGRYSGGGAGSVKISGTIDGQERQFVTDVKFAEQDTANSYIPRLWATRRVGWLLDEIRMHGENAELRDEIVRLARQYGIVTPYTAYLIMEDERIRGVPLARQSFSEMNADHPVAHAANGIYESARREASDAASQSGPQAVANVQTMQQLKAGQNVQDSQYAASQPMMRSVAGGGGAAANQGYRFATNYAQQVRVVNGRAFYQNNNVWTDSSIQFNDKLKTRQIQLASDDYFDLIARHPEAAAWLSLGQQVDLIIGDELISVR